VGGETVGAGVPAGEAREREREKRERGGKEEESQYLRKVLTNSSNSGRSYSRSRSASG
jgi:hypothetical protein